MGGEKPFGGYFLLWRQEVVLSDGSRGGSWIGDIDREASHKLLSGQGLKFYISRPLLHPRTWTGTLEENQDAITDLHTDSTFASPAFEVILNTS